jgi:hypothetical protein
MADCDRDAGQTGKRPRRSGPRPPGASDQPDGPACWPIRPCVTANWTCGPSSRDLLTVAGDGAMVTEDVPAPWSGGVVGPASAVQVALLGVPGRGLLSVGLVGGGAWGWHGRTCGAEHVEQLGGCLPVDPVGGRREGMLCGGRRRVWGTMRKSSRPRLNSPVTFSSCRSRSRNQPRRMVRPSASSRRSAGPQRSGLKAIRVTLIARRCSSSTSATTPGSDPTFGGHTRRPTWYVRLMG